MKKLKYLLLILLFIPTCVFADSYNIDSNVTVELDDSWYIFTPDNIKDNKNIKETGLTEEYLSDYMKRNDVYLNAYLITDKKKKDKIELVMVKKELTNDMGNLHAYPEDEINDFAKDIVKSADYFGDDYKIFGDKVKYVEFDYETGNYEAVQFITTMNGYGYYFMFTKNKIESKSEIDLISISENVMKDVSFKIDPKFDQVKKRSKIEVNKIQIIAGIICVVCIICFIIVRVLSKKKKVSKKKIKK